MTAHINRIGTALPPNDVHPAFLDFARTLLATDKERSVFDRMAGRSGITRRFSDFRAGVPGAARVDADGFYNRGRFPSTAVRMRLYETRSVELSEGGERLHLELTVARAGSKAYDTLLRKRRARPLT